MSNIWERAGSPLRTKEWRGEMRQGQGRQEMRNIWRLGPLNPNSPWPKATPLPTAALASVLCLVPRTLGDRQLPGVPTVRSMHWATTSEGSSQRRVFFSLEFLLLWAKGTGWSAGEHWLPNSARETKPNFGKYKVLKRDCLLIPDSCGMQAGSRIP